MANIFAQLKEFVDKPKRNNFDLSFGNHFTGDFGYLYPVFCKEVLPGDSWSIKPSFGLRFMPLVFPVQTRMKANLHFFYVRNRNLWKDWMDFIGRTKNNLVPPYLSDSRGFDITTGSLSDYLGAPTTLYGDYGNVVHSTTDLIAGSNKNLNLKGLVFSRSSNTPVTSPRVTQTQSPGFMSLSTMLSNSGQNASTQAQNTYFANTGYGACRLFVSDPFDLESLPDGNINHSLGFYMNSGQGVSGNNVVVYIFVKYNNDWYPMYCLYWKSFLGNSSFVSNNLGFVSTGESTGYYTFNCNRDSLRFCSVDSNTFPNITYSYSEFIDLLKSQFGSTQVRISIGNESAFSQSGESPDPDESSTSIGSASGNQFAVGRLSTGRVTHINVHLNDGEDFRDVRNMGALNPYVRGDLKISTLPHRAYDSIYNAFYRNQFNDPFIIDGQKEFNKFIRSNDGGEDSLEYSLHRRNWELDFLTSAKQSPVDGDITPLVGVSGSGEFTFQNPDESTYTVKPVIGEDGHTLTGIDSMEGTPANNSGLRRLVDLISVGISINDFRNVNSLQRWLETNLRRGYRYKDQLMSHFGVDAKFEELDMPEFIGGMSETVVVNQINQSVDMTGNPSGLGDFSKVLGSFAGQASILAESKHTITRYCDEHGFIIGILSVTPVPVYSQLLPKYFIKDNVLDYFFPSFGHIGNQPITYKEVCPLQAYAAGDPLTDVFGYQRAWYDYIGSVDEVHGDFRTTLNGFLINRVFNSKPELGKDFIEVNKDAMSDPFSVTDDTNKILGELYFECYAKRPIPKFGIPRLE